VASNSKIIYFSMPAFAGFRYLKKQGLPFIFIWSGCLLFFAIFTIFPLIFSFATVRFKDFFTVFCTSRYKAVILNTIYECLVSTLISVLFGYIYAYAIERANIPFSKLFSLIPLIHLVTPPFVGGLSFILLFGKQGFITHTLLGLDISLYGFPGIVISQVFCFFPLAFLICSQTLRGINPLFERAAFSMGASPLKVFFSITLPLSVPGILSSALFIAVSVLSDFGNPLIVGGRFKVLAVEIYTQLTGWLNAPTSVALGIVLIVPSVVLFLLQTKFFRQNYMKTATVGGKETYSEKEKTSLCTRILLTLFCSVLSFLILSQFISIVFGSFQKLWGIDTSFTFAHIKSVCRYGKEIANSICFALLAAVLSTVFAILVAFLVQKTKCPLRSYFDILAQLPSAVPGTLLGLSYSFAANKIGFNCAAFLIVLAMTVSFLPFSYKIVMASYLQQKNTLDYGAQSLGAGKIYSLFTITVPISIQGIFSSFLYVFVRSVGTLSAVVFLVSFNTKLASVSILNLAEQGDWGKSAALALVLTTLTFFILGLGNFFEKKIIKREACKC